MSRTFPSPIIFVEYERIRCINWFVIIMVLASKSSHRINEVLDRDFVSEQTLKIDSPASFR